MPGNAVDMQKSYDESIWIWSYNLTSYTCTYAIWRLNKECSTADQQARVIKF